MKKEKPEWPKEMISIPTLREMVSEVLLETEDFVTSNDTFGAKMSLERTSKGEKYHEKMSGDGLLDFPEDPSNPVIRTDEVYSGDIVNENIDFKRLGEETGLRKLAGYEMEGYSFLYSAEENLPHAPSSLCQRRLRSRHTSV